MKIQKPEVMRYLLVFIIKIITFLAWLMLMIVFGLALLLTHLWTFRNIHWKTTWYKYMGSPTLFAEERETPLILLRNYLNTIKYRQFS